MFGEADTEPGTPWLPKMAVVGKHFPCVLVVV